MPMCHLCDFNHDCDDYMTMITTTWLIIIFKKVELLVKYMQTK